LAPQHVRGELAQRILKALAADIHLIECLHGGQTGGTALIGGPHGRALICGLLRHETQLRVRVRTLSSPSIRRSTTENRAAAMRSSNPPSSAAGTPARPSSATLSTICSRSISSPAINDSAS